MHSFYKSALLALFFFTAGNISAQETGDTISVDNIVTALKLNKKGLLPFGFKPGAAAEAIKAAMGRAEVFKEDSGYVTYTIYFSGDKYDFGDVTFDFSDGKVTDVSIETYFGKKETSSRGLNLLKKNFDKLYKPGEYSDNTLRWKYSKKGTNLWIQLSEIEFEGDNGFVIDFLTSEPAE
ncbi:MAG TPA: hypothetical protein VNJ07_00825 [Chitinophagales bacterium]|nr:hypothetical protein [Chitinophagales bacterium]